MNREKKSKGYTNTVWLVSAMHLRGFDVCKLAEEMGCSVTSMSNKVLDLVLWKVSEMMKCASILGLSATEVDIIWGKPKEGQKKEALSTPIDRA